MSIIPMKNWRDYPNGKEKYQLYLASREWAVLKEAVRKRSGGTCERCANAPAQQVHHQTYERVYQEVLTDLVHLCPPCHEFLSGKLERDPVFSGPVRLMGRTIQTVYLAGKITNTTWRDQIVTKGWSFENHSAIDFDLSEGVWKTIKGCLPLPDGRRLDLTGPYWQPSIDCGGHGRIQNSFAIHSFTKLTNKDEILNVDPGILDLVVQIRSSIKRSDLVFAWIDSMDCFGTLVEIGYAFGQECVVVVASPPDFDTSDIWMPFSFRHIGGTYDTPGEAWNALWSNPRLAAEPPEALR